jgi:hypothetical protein
LSVKAGIFGDAFFSRKHPSSQVYFIFLLPGHRAARGKSIASYIPLPRPAPFKVFNFFIFSSQVFTIYRNETSHIYVFTKSVETLNTHTHKATKPTSYAQMIYYGRTSIGAFFPLKTIFAEQVLFPLREKSPNKIKQENSTTNT